MIKYLYIDDEKNETIDAYINKLTNENLTIEYKHVDDVNSEDFFINNLKNYDGILLDLRTDEFSETSNFTGSVWGQHIRDLVTNKKVDIDIPIVLFSTDKKLRETYFKDMTSNNIFDRFLTKDNIPDNAIEKLISLANGYKQILETKDFNDLLKIDISNLDERIFSRFHGSSVDIPTHEYAQMILKDLIYAKGVLLNEKYLASRLGVDRGNSDDWDKVKEKFSNAKYNGVFSDAWDRWMMYEVDDIFEEIADTYLSYLDAKERVGILKDKLKLTELNYPELIEENSSYDYWTVCKALKKPLDQMEGFRVYSTSEPKPWQEYEYVSLYALLTKDPMLKDKDIKVHPLDKEKADNKLKKYNG
jgi:hypothetical protein